jgi:hypothetical protein
VGQYREAEKENGTGISGEMRRLGAREGWMSRKVGQGGR